MADKGLTEKQRKFVLEYTKSGNGTEAAILAGYSAKTAAGQASRLLEHPGVKAYRAELEEKLFRESGLSQAWVGNRLMEVVERCMAGKPHESWNPETRKKEPDGLWIFDAAGATKALHELGQHVGLFRAEGEKEASSETLEEMLARIAKGGKL